MALSFFALLPQLVRATELGHVLAVLAAATILTLITRLARPTTLAAAATAAFTAAAAAALVLGGWKEQSITYNIANANFYLDFYQSHLTYLYMHTKWILSIIMLQFSEKRMWSKYTGETIL